MTLRGWCRMKLINILDVVKIANRSVDRFSGVKRYIATGDLSENTISSYTEVTYDNRPSRANVEVKTGQVIFARMKDTKKVLLIDDDNVDFIYSTGFCVFEPSKAILSDYLRLILNSDLFQNQKDKYSKGATQKAINNAGLKKIQIPVPQLENQKKIVEVLDKAQGLIDARKEQITLMDELIQSVFYEMFGDPVTNPKGWEVRTVEKVCTNIMGGGTPSKCNLDFYVGDIPWVTPKDMKIDFISDSMDHINEDAINNSSAKLIPENSVLMVIRSGILKRKLPVAINKRCVAVNQDMKAFIINKNFTNSEFFMYFWKSCENYILSKVRAVTADNIEFKQIKDMQYILPPCELQYEFSEKVQQIQTNKTLLEMSLCELENNLSGLMQSAFAGSLFDDLVVGK